MDYRRCGLRQFDNRIVVKTILPSSIGLRDFASFGGGFVSEKPIQVVHQKCRDVVSMFLFHLVKREPCANEVGFQQNFDRD